MVLAEARRGARPSTRDMKRPELKDGSEHVARGIEAQCPLIAQEGSPYNRPAGNPHECPARGGERGDGDATIPRNSGVREARAHEKSGREGAKSSQEPPNTEATGQPSPCCGPQVVRQRTEGPGALTFHGEEGHDVQHHVENVCHHE